MGQYIYSSYLRREGKRRLGESRDPLTVAIASSRVGDNSLFANVAVTVPFDSSGIKGDFPDSVRIAECDIVLCEFSDLARVLASVRQSGKNIVNKVISISGVAASLDAAAFDKISQLMAELDLEFVSYQSHAVDFRKTKSVVIVLARKADTMRDSWRDLLKTAIGLEAHALHGAAIEFVRRCNSLLAEDRLDETEIDRTYEMEAFARGEYTEMLQRSWTTGTVGPSRLALPADQETSVSERGRHLSVHFDMLHRADGMERLLQLAESLACPEHTQIVARIPGTDVSSQLELIAGNIRTRGAAIEWLKDPSKTGAPNPGARGFVELTAPEARVAVYWGAERLPACAGWDHELLLAATHAMSSVFALKTSSHKTRNFIAPEDAIVAPEGFPAVSRTWLEVCGAWSSDGLSAGQFQSLVAFYFDHIDWMDKHRALRLIPLMTLRTEPIQMPDDAAQSGRTEEQRAVVAALRRAEGEAIRIALHLQARDWSDQNHATALRVEYHAAQRSLTLRDARDRQVHKTWSAGPARLRVPL